ncbi:hypothetical protein C1I98_23475 [Spongiactinospora gelatinilytica]|uniref:HTH arsR-type domain-containing protein n=1 Tax=Spongiactinospora gelatinilytica TaxID=2666298 RepID=A0A2W2FV64_9ACTN|nr:hypothetical protein C1I98_23475 [Spongiactinospora gelatinilytica]
MSASIRVTAPAGCTTGDRPADSHIPGRREIVTIRSGRAGPELHGNSCIIYRVAVAEPPPEPAGLGTIKALANPIRQRILDHLREGPATSTTLAKALGITTGGTSYNLWVLAEHGLVEEVPELARGRGRWWRPVPVDRCSP